MKKNHFLFFALLLFAGALHAQRSDRTYITLVNDYSETANYDDLRAFLSLDVIYIGFGEPACITVAITGENNETLFYKELGRASSHSILMNYTGIPNGEYTLNVFWNDCWWRGDFVFMSHKPEGQYVYSDSTYYRLNKGTAVTVEPDLNGRTRSHRMYWDIFERDYPLHVVIPSKLTYEGGRYEVIGIEHSSFHHCHFLLSVDLPNTITFIGQCAFADCDKLPQVNIPEGVQTIETYAFSGCTSLTSVILPESMTRIDDNAFSSMPNTAHIYCNAKEPFTICENTFNFKNTLYVPQGCREKYENATYWKDFTKIVEIGEEPDGPEVYSGETGVSPAIWSEDAESPAFDLSGKPVDASYKGIVIRNGKKVMIR